LDQVFLCHLRAHIAAVRSTVGSDNGQGNVVTYPRFLFRRKEVAARGFEELQDRRVFEGRRVGDVDDDASARERFAQALTRNRVDARSGRGRDHVMTEPTELVYQFRPDTAGTTDHYDFHIILPSLWPRAGAWQQLTQPTPSGNRRECASALDEGQQVPIDHLGVRRAHAVRKLLVDLQGGV